MQIDRQEIADLIPHAGTMCLLDGVLGWDSVSIRCISRTHRQTDNPLRRDGALHALCGLEYGAQAMAIHGALTGAVGARPGAGYVVRVRDLAWQVQRLDLLASDLMIFAEKMAGEGTGVIYRFALTVDDALVLEGRATVMLEGKAP